MMPEDVHVMFLLVATCQLSPPFGVSTVINVGRTMLKVALLESLSVAFCESTTRTRAVVVGVFGIVHAYEPVDAATLIASVVHAPFGAVLYEISTAFTAVDDQVMF